ncbi:MAG TPA: polysaccharide biosynthesis/export family protein [archaeon]|nr:polysaccharide biosynthesis/export family protein [archaeon]
MRFNLGRASIMLLILALVGASGTLRGQRYDLLEKRLPKLGEKVGQVRLPSTSKTTQMVPLEGKIDRESYRLGPGDEVDVSIWGAEEDQSYQLFISAEGRLLVPSVGPLDLAGMTLVEGEELLRQKLSYYYSNARISLSLINPRSFRVFAVGAVNEPGTYILSAVDRVGDLIRSAGGIKRGGSWRRIRLLTKEKELIAELDLLSHDVLGDLAANELLTDGCIVEVPSVENLVVLRGRFANLADKDSVTVKAGQKDVFNEYEVEFLPGETLGDLLKLVGKPLMPEENGPPSVIIKKPGGSDLEFIGLDNRLLEQRLEDGTVYEFPVRKNWVFVTGAVNSAGRYIYQPGLTVQEYLGQAGGPSYMGSDKVCYLRRLDGTRVKSTPTEKVLPGDEIFVPEKFHWDRLFPIMAGVATAAIYVIFK